MEIKKCSECRFYQVVKVTENGECCRQPTKNERRPTDMACVYGKGFGSTHQRKAAEIENLIEGK